MSSSAPAVRPARREEVRSGAGARGGTPKVVIGGAFVPHWKAPEEDLRAPMFRAGGIAIAELPVEEPAEARAGMDELAESEGYRAAPLVAEPRAGAHEDDYGAARRFAATDTIKGEAPERDGTRSVLVASVIGVVIAGVIVAGAFLLRPGAPEATETAPEAPAAAPAE